MNLNLNRYKTSIIVEYVINDAPVIKKDNISGQINQEIIKVGNTREILLKGDINCRIGKIHKIR